jgi:hypothetical protein
MTKAPDGLVEGIDALQREIRNRDGGRINQPWAAPS